MIRSLIIILSLLGMSYAQESKIVWLNYPTVGCITCHRIASERINDTIFLIGSFHSQNNKLKPFLIALDDKLNIKWLKAFDNNLSNAGIVSMKKINDSLVAMSGGHTYAYGQCPNNNCSFFGIFNIKNKNFVWSKYRQIQQGGWHTSITAIDFDGNNLIVGAQSMVNNKGSWISKVDLDGNILWQKLVYINNVEFSIMDVVVHNQDYVFLIRNASGENPTLLKVSQNGTLLWVKSYDFGGYDYPYKILKDIDGYIVVGFRCLEFNCSNLNNDDIFVFKVDFNGNILWAKLYSSNLQGFSEDRAYNATFDYDGNILVSGFIRASNDLSFPLILKVNRTNGNLIWARYWDTPPMNTNSNQAKGVISIGKGKFYLMTFIGSGTDASGGIAIIREDTALSDNCTKLLNFNVSNPNIIVNNININFVDGSYTLSNLNLQPYEPQINQAPQCYITPVNNLEAYFDCGVKIISGKGYLEISSSKVNLLKIYNTSGSLIYSKKVFNKEKIYLKEGLYIIRVNDKISKILVRG